MKRPFQVAMLGWLFIAVGLISTIYHFLKSPLDRWTLPILLVGIIAIVAGVFFLRGASWARWLVRAWLAFHIVVSAVGCYATRRASFGRRLLLEPCKSYVITGAFGFPLLRTNASISSSLLS